MNWDKPEERQEWYHNMSSVMQAGPCIRSNQLDYDEDVMYKVSIPLQPWSLRDFLTQWSRLPIEQPINAQFG